MFQKRLNSIEFHWLVNCVLPVTLFVKKNLKLVHNWFWFGGYTSGALWRWVTLFVDNSPLRANGTNTMIETIVITFQWRCLRVEPFFREHHSDNCFNFRWGFITVKKNQRSQNVVGRLIVDGEHETRFREWISSVRCRWVRPSDPYISGAVSRWVSIIGSMITSFWVILSFEF